MPDNQDLLIERWTVDYGDGSEPEAIRVPHAWRQDLPVNSEGPALYRSSLEVPKADSKLLFSGVSYAAEVFINDLLVMTHEGIWDAFDVPLWNYLGTKIEIAVSVTKNGGPSYPIAEVASGFLPYVFHTFGGIFRAVAVVEAERDVCKPAARLSRVSIDGSRIFLDGKPFYPRGLLHWGWYPDLGHPNPPDEVIRAEVISAKKLGFNLVKFCLWVPPHRYLEILREEGMEAWMELPIWQPKSEPEALQHIGDEIERIVCQYRHHQNILFWTVGSEFGAAVPLEFRAKLARVVKNLTGALLVKDSSVGSEAGGKEIDDRGDFLDYHPYCDTLFYPEVLDSLVLRSTVAQPTLLGEFNDVDVHRDLDGLANEIPFWGSNLTELNDKGVRWQYDLPEVLSDNRFANYPTRERHQQLMESSRQKALFMRKIVQEWVRQRDSISGYVINGWRDTPITSSGFFDDWDNARFTSKECTYWNGPTCLHFIPNRLTPWIHGGNRASATDPLNRFTGALDWKVGVHSEESLSGGLVWRIFDQENRLMESGAEAFLSVPALQTYEVGHIRWQCDVPGEYQLHVEFGSACNRWTFWVVEAFTAVDREVWKTYDPSEAFGFESKAGELTLSTEYREGTQRGVVVLAGEGTVPRPFWREAAYEFRNDSFWMSIKFAEKWGRLLPVCSDRVLDSAWLQSLGVSYETLLNRIDTRTYAEHPVLVRAGNTFLTTLRPQGGLGCQPSGVPRNAAGTALLRGLANSLLAKVE